MNCKIVIVSLIALCCIQLALAGTEDRRKLRRGRSARRTRSYNSSKSSTKSFPLDQETQPKNAKFQINNDWFNDSSEPTNFKGALFFSPSGQLLNIGNPSTSKAPINAKVADNIPIQKPGMTVTVEGKNNDIYINGNLKYPNDKAFSGGQVHVRYQNGNFYVNNNLVMKKGRADHDNVFQSTHNLDYFGVSRFILKIKSDGIMKYEDDKGINLDINYYTPKDKIPDLNFLNNMFKF